MILFELVRNGVLQIIYLVGLIIFFGLMVSVCNKAFYRLMGSKLGNKIIISTSIIGTPVHELGHAAMCLIFGHKIVEMKLFISDKDSDTLGYVKHTYNKNNVYQRLGNFFIGIGPIFSGSLALMLGMSIFVPVAFDAFRDTASQYAPTAMEGFHSDSLGQTFSAISEIVLSFFSLSMILSWRWWIFLALGMCIALHIKFSPQDISGSANGFLALCTAVLLFNIIIGLIDTTPLYSLNKALMVYNIYLIGLLMIALIFSLLLVLFALVVHIIRQITKKVSKKHRYAKIKSGMVSKAKQATYDKRQKEIENSLRKQNPNYKSPDERINEIRAKYKNVLENRENEEQ